MLNHTRTNYDILSLQFMLLFSSSLVSFVVFLRFFVCCRARIHSPNAHRRVAAFASVHLEPIVVIVRCRRSGLLSRRNIGFTPYGSASSPRLVCTAICV